jgi:hypothetical protein
MLIIFVPMIASIVLLVQQQIIQHRMLEQLEAKHLSTIIIKKGNLKWTRPGKEIELGGKLFDVKEVTEKDGSYTIKGLYDEKEDAITLSLKKTAQSSGKNAWQLVMAKAFATVLFIENKNIWQHFTAIDVSRQYPLPDIDKFSSLPPAITVPPPRA